MIFSNEQNQPIIGLEEMLDMPISTASKYQQKIGDAPASVRIITAEDITRYGYHTLSDALRSIAGFYITYDRNYWYLGTRGFSRPTDYNDRILLLLNGHSLNENVFLSAYFGDEAYLPLEDVERIEIVRGPGSALYGTNAMFAVINVITKNGKQMNGLRMSSRYGSSNMRGGSASFGKSLLNDEVDLMVSGGWFYNPGENQYYREFDDPVTNNGIAEGLDWSKYWGILSSLSYHGLTLEGFVTSKWKGVPTASYETVFNDPNEKTLDENGFVKIQYESTLSPKMQLFLKMYLDHYDYGGTYPYGIYQTHDSTNGNWAGGEVRFSYDVLSNIRVIAGGEVQEHSDALYMNEYVLSDTVLISFSRNMPYSTRSVFIEGEFQAFTNVLLTAGIRYDNHSREGNSFSPRAAIIYHPLQPTTFKLLYGHAFRTPNIWEKYFEDKDFSLIDATIVPERKSNSGLTSEQIHTVEMVWEQRITEWLYASTSVFGYRMYDQIDVFTDENDPYQREYYDNIARVEAKGVETSFDVRLPNGLSGYLNYTLQYALQVPDKIKLSNSPTNMAKIGISVPTGKYVYASMELYYETSRKSAAIYDTLSAPVFLSDLNLRTARLFNHVRASAYARNIFNVQYAHPGGFEHTMPLIRQDGRTFGLQIDIFY
ncbi:MAG: hypothetical protein A2268_06670 [Candidatus Raymondbacteria bacterium RifOxyA12_full_50_37]|uniref:TonB-dependent receptor plug domain-containing protein n=1 Tax=Candidatus Raymondbacteria bacterium RIFOXYD12_FULL_49_13 TaxID=1817890 RepID=A0A1F7F7K4_UNCRA|nr:MAG: hypothetical protein A2268_06670 [Candidatus Raymondbacteria bacterium RifOxyA12_full_50_37]OGJ88750.1 MAG: hypothetical protein A2248_07810 [Candidatus Raymondbacteria bacterium RIFOXYA2_FULL_49_16]OGJ95246.1 MAG: hypothetical protein A2350_14725 [Candidatus Raymondbacteria bacterium RifOxyB12_full_50_8]OGK02532.1 MAG: hypothetical protein A2519_12070 [Candidatus Raymondbacteria bacterium RIFOXYD12_FULL_49_13]OGP42125.1 MAG: hypothetical protein A2324_14940 [Candidatus Raymondbacteria 